MTAIPLERALDTATGPVDPRQVVFPAGFDNFERVREILGGEQRAVAPADPCCPGPKVSLPELEKKLIANERRRIFYLVLAKFLREHERFEKLLREQKKNYQLLLESERLLVKLARYPIGKLDRVSKKMQEVSAAITAFFQDKNLILPNSDQLGNFALFMCQPWRTQEQQQLIRRRLSGTETKIMAPMAHPIIASEEPVEWAQVMMRQLIAERLNAWSSLDLAQPKNRNKVIESMRSALYCEWFEDGTQKYWRKLQENLLKCVGTLDPYSFILDVSKNVSLVAQLQVVLAISAEYHMRGIVATTRNLVARFDRESENKLCEQVRQFKEMYDTLSRKQKNRGCVSQDFIDKWRGTFGQWRQLALKIQSEGLKRTLGEELVLVDPWDCVELTVQGTIKEGLGQIEENIKFVDSRKAPLRR